MIIRTFHTTIIDYLDLIMKFGLIPGRSKPSGQTWLGKYSGRGIYLHSQLPQHELNSGCDEDGEPFMVTLEVIFDADTNLIVPDEDVSNDPNYGITAYENGESIVYLGKISKNSIKSIYVPAIFGNEESEEMVANIYHKYGNLVKKWEIIEGRIRLKNLILEYDCLIDSHNE